MIDKTIKSNYMSSGAFIKGSKSLTVSYNGKVYTIPLGIESEQVLQAINEDRWDDIPSLVDKATSIQNYSKGNFVVRNGVIFIDDDELPTLLSNTILQFMEEKAPYQALVKFWHRLKNNPSYRAVNELYGFLQANNIPILSDGRILTYKVVRKANKTDYRASGTHKYGKVTVVSHKAGVPQYSDIHSNTVLQSVGDVVSIERRNVDEDASRTCSYGLHQAAWSYVPHFGRAMSGDDVVLECAVDPADVVAIPLDYNNAKLRCAKYEILGVNEDLTERRQAYVPDYNLSDDEDNSDADWFDSEEDEDDDFSYDDWRYTW